MLSFVKGLLPGGFPWKLAGGIFGIIAVVGAIWLLIKTLDSWTDKLYNNGFRAGSDMMEKQWHSANSKALEEQRNMVVADAVNTNNAVKAYLADIAGKEPEVIRVKERTTIYEKSAAGIVQCLDVDGVGLLQDNRKALGFPAASP